MAHASQQELTSKVNDAMKQVEIGAVYKHYRDSSMHYKVLAIGFIEETDTICVIYQALYAEKIIWVRPFNLWLSKAQTEEGEVSRFQKIE